ncbi:T9SS C-terminal target domain-containing protein [candidate division KSB1 bacterium]|nr:MAG: T9SS C-terminal target domain-containing protein [candidate division KSB1 bacterium]
MKHLLRLAFFVICATDIFAQPPSVQWYQTYVVGVRLCEFFTVKQTPDGGYICGGQERSTIRPSNSWIMKWNSNGGAVWSRVYGGNGSQACNSICPTADGGFLCAGVHDLDQEDFLLLKLNANGDSLWSRTYGGAGDDACAVIQPTADGGFVLAGRTASFGSGQADFWLLKVNSNGDSLWSRTYGGPSPETCYTLDQTTDGGFILAGVTRSFGDSNNDFWLVKTDDDGDSLWSRSFRLPGYTYCRSVFQTPDGGYAMGGYTSEYDALPYGDFLLVKADANGDSLWSRIYGSNQYTEKCTAMQMTRESGFILVGLCYNREYDSFPNCMLVKTDANGDSLWGRRFGLGAQGILYAHCQSIQQTQDHGFIICGKTTHNVGDTEGLLFKTYPDNASLIGLDPDTLAFGDVWIGRAVEDSFRIINLSSETMAIQSITSNYPVFPSVEGTFSIPPAGRHNVLYTVTLPDTFNYRGTLTIQGSEDQATLPVSAHGIWTELRPNPSAIHLGQVSVSDTVDTTLTLFSAGNTFLTVDSIRLTAHHFTVTLPPADTIPAYGSTLIAVRYIAATTESVSDTLIIENSAGTPLTIPLSIGNSSVDDATGMIPNEFFLDQNYPNPFNPSTSIAFDLPRRAFVSMEVFDLLGRHTASLLSQTINPGHHSVQWSCTDCSSGLYLVRMHVEGRAYTRKMLFIR